MKCALRVLSASLLLQILVACGSAEQEAVNQRNGNATQTNENGSDSKATRDNGHSEDAGAASQSDAEEDSSESNQDDVGQNGNSQTNEIPSVTPGGDDQTNPTSGASKGRVTSIGVLGQVYGYAVNSADETQTISVHFYIDGIKGQGLDAGTVKANLDAADGNAAGAHSFSFDLPEAFKDGKPHQLYAYAVMAATNGTVNELPLGGSEVAVSFTAYKLSTAGRDYFDANVRSKMTACASCHTVAYEQQFYSLISPSPAGGGTATNNQLFNKPSQSNGTSHGGGRRCANANASPCREFQVWWDIEFGG